MSETKKKLEIEYIYPSAYIAGVPDADGVTQRIEQFASICYQSNNERKQGELLKQLIRSKHESPLEHISVTAYIETSRAVSHELVRHRLCSVTMASQRFINFNNRPVRVVVPVHLHEGFQVYEQKLISAQKTDPYWVFWGWKNTIDKAIEVYGQCIDFGQTPQEARHLLPNAVATQLYMTANLREWRHIFNLRVKGTTGAPDPNMLATLKPLYDEFVKTLPLVFGEE